MNAAEVANRSFTRDCISSRDGFSLSGFRQDHRLPVGRCIHHALDCGQRSNPMHSGLIAMAPSDPFLLYLIGGLHAARSIHKEIQSPMYCKHCSRERLVATGMPKLFFPPTRR